MFIQEVLEQAQAKLEQAQITTICAVNDNDPILKYGQRAQEDDPNVSQASRDHQAREPRRIRDVAFVEIEATAFLVGEEGLNSIPFAVPVTGFINQLQVRDEIYRLFVFRVPSGNGQDWAVGLKREKHVGYTDALSTLDAQIFKSEPFVIGTQLGILGHTTRVQPLEGFQCGL